MEEGGGSARDKVADLLYDVRLAFRGLMRAPAFALIAVLSLAVGIGANVTLFTGVHSVFFEPVPGVTGAEQIVELLVLEQGSERQEWPTSMFEAVRDTDSPLEAVAGWKQRDGSLTGADGPGGPPGRGGPGRGGPGRGGPPGGGPGGEPGAGGPPSG